jgi:hypothetical protein
MLNNARWGMFGEKRFLLKIAPKSYKISTLVKNNL